MTVQIAEGIMLRACQIRRMTPDEVRQRTRVDRFVKTRQAIAYALRKRTQWSLPKIARYIGVSDHSTVMHAYRKADAALAAGDEWTSLITSLLEATEIPFGNLEIIFGKEGSRPPQAQPLCKKPEGMARAHRPYVPPPPKPEDSWEMFDAGCGKRIELNKLGETKVEAEKRRYNARGNAKFVALLLAARA